MEVRQKSGRCEGRLVGPIKFAVPVCAHAAGKACLRRIQIAERNEAERGQAGEGRVVTRKEVK